MPENTCSCKPQIEALQIQTMTLQQELLVLRAALLKTNFEDELVDFETKLQIMWRTDVQARMRQVTEESLLSSEIIGASDDAA